MFQIIIGCIIANILMIVILGIALYSVYKKNEEKIETKVEEIKEKIDEVKEDVGEALEIIEKLKDIVGKFPGIK